ncbi:hypothetical protein [Alteribacillus sp. HJP-4]|uniref:hypothetical protein n=1 Tax=Alteribacillus sp. HJP-4 TaxID=2775394 RepID=UPI0035CCD27B
MKTLVILLTAAVLFLGGMITGTHYSHYYFSENEESADDPVKENSQPEKIKQENEPSLKQDLIEKQKKMQKAENENIFSGLGRSLDIFHPERRTNIDND